VPPARSISYDQDAFYAAKEAVMLGLLLVGAAFVLVCLYIAYERLCDRL
jgi:hypothetical protein